MKITKMENSDETKLSIRASMRTEEFKQLNGNINGLCLFSPELIQDHASFIRTGKRHSYAKYLLFPSVLRRSFKTSTFDFEQMKCGVLDRDECMYVIYRVPKKLGALLEPVAAVSSTNS